MSSERPYWIDALEEAFSDIVEVVILGPNLITLRYEASAMPERLEALHRWLKERGIEDFKVQFAQMHKAFDVREEARWVGEVIFKEYSQVACWPVFVWRFFQAKSAVQTGELRFDSYVECFQVRPNKESAWEHLQGVDEVLERLRGMGMPEPCCLDEVYDAFLECIYSGSFQGKEPDRSSDALQFLYKIWTDIHSECASGDIKPKYAGEQNGASPPIPRGIQDSLKNISLDPDSDDAKPA